ncbi:hypothetical protein GIB67_035187 [Kingdonia uniflora]|uniref:Uncharacterized protein n=1 Tax=Kingdonia uniflora TaxID=39325 RepID=A0A7J7LDZ4_9MAGN|nr:hypothetical protein GIB67_035187 [Kingdonia uniflora]
MIFVAQEPDKSPASPGLSQFPSLPLSPINQCYISYFCSSDLCCAGTRQVSRVSWSISICISSILSCVFSNITILHTFLSSFQIDSYSIIILYRDIISSVSIYVSKHMMNFFFSLTFIISIHYIGSV